MKKEEMYFKEEYNPKGYANFVLIVAYIVIVGMVGGFLYLITELIKRGL